MAPRKPGPTLVLMKFLFNLITACLSVTLLLSCAPSGRMGALPARMLWAWERPEDLGSLDPRKAGVAYLAWTFTLRGEALATSPRRQPLIVPAGTALLAVARIEVDHGLPFRAGPAQRAALVRGILGRLRPEVLGLQIDFDARESERPFCRALLQDLRREMAPAMPLSMTALASWALFDDWIRDLPVDEAVPMCFDMGADSGAVRSRIRDGADFRVPLARRATGVCLQEPLPRLPGHFWQRRRTYVFSHAPWNPARVAQAMEVT